jgi:lipoprotein-releasing system permease protein
LNPSLFIAKRIRGSESKDNELSKPIIRIATLGVGLGIAVMILAASIVTGFQEEIRNKVIGFGSHIQITNFGSSNNELKSRLLIDQPFYPSLDTLNEVASINQFALKEGIIETPENIQGILAKGVSEDYNWNFLKQKIVEGDVLKFQSEKISDSLLISSFLAGRLGLKLGDKMPIYFQNARNKMSQRNFTVSGIYNTGLKEMDEEFVFIDIRQIKVLNQWGIEAYALYEGCSDNTISVAAKGNGGDGEYRYAWSVDSTLQGPGPHPLKLKPGETYFVAISDRSQTIPDTAYFLVPKDFSCFENTGLETWNSGGSAKYYTGGFEVQLRSFNDLDRMDQIIYENIDYNFKTTTIKQHLPEIFNWLEMLDLNTIIIIVLMIVISIINMTSALLIMIMERTQTVGLLKALGGSSWFIQKIFLTNAAYIIGIGLVGGNLIGIGLAFIQKTTGIIKLDPENYYVSEVPVMLDLSAILGLNLLTLVVCIITMILPSLAVNQIAPSRALRFD